MKALLCGGGCDIKETKREWRTDRSWRWCQCGESAVRWRDGDAGLLEVTSAGGRQHVRVLGINNAYLGLAVNHPPAIAAGWRELHHVTCAEIAPHYLFHADRRDCWALVVRPGESGDITFVEYAEATAGSEAAS